jgi:3-isopropylmalate/(R)-2-methylmalate dehydratase small subunit
VTLPLAAIARLHAELSPEARCLTIDLEDRIVTTPSGERHAFSVAPLDRRLLLSGTDATTVVLGHEPEIAAFQAADRERRPWVYAVSRDRA